MLKNKIIFLTGATDGIGKQTAFMLAEKNAMLLMHGKNIEKGLEIRDEIIRKTKNTNIFYFNADFTSFRDIQILSTEIHKQFNTIDILINNAGVYENKKIILVNGIEKTFMVNHLASFSLTLKFLDLLKKSNKARIINVSSMIHANSIDFENLNSEKYYSGDDAYSRTKLCNILFSNRLNSIVNDKSITINTLHPGVINTKLLRAGWGGYGNTTIEGAKRIFYLATSKDVENISGKYFMNDKQIKPSEIAFNKTIQKRLWDISINFTENGGKGIDYN